MKKTFFALDLLAVMLFLLLTACTHPAVPTEPETELAFPGARWNMTPEDLIQALHLKKGEYQVSESPYAESTDASRPSGSYSIQVTDMEVFGKNGQVGFRFYDFTGSGRYGLVYIVVEYPEDTDMQAVKAAMIKAYGEPSPYGSEHNDPDYKKHVTVWYSKVTQYNVLSQKQLQAFSEDMLETIRERPLTYIFWSDEAERALIGTQGSPNGISFQSTLNEMLSLEIG